VSISDLSLLYGDRDESQLGNDLATAQPGRSG
jgi:hypothetical protein